MLLLKWKCPSFSNHQLFLCSGYLENYTSDYTLQVLVGYCAVYIFMQTFMIPGTIFMSLLAGALFGQLRGVALVVFAATAGASSCYFLSKMIGKPLVFSLWPDKLSFFQKQVISEETLFAVGLTLHHCSAILKYLFWITLCIIYALWFKILRLWSSLLRSKLCSISGC